MNNELQVYYESRLKNVLIKDKEDNPLKIKNVLKSEILNVLKNYMEVIPDNFDLEISISENGCYKIEFVALVKYLKSVACFI